MYSDDDGDFTLSRGGGRSPTPPERHLSRGKNDRSGKSQSRDRGGRDDRGRPRRSSSRRGREEDNGRRDGNRRGRSRSPRVRDDRGKEGGKGATRDLGKERVLGKGKGGKERPRTTGKELPKLYSVHKGSIASVRDYGAFVRLGDGSEYKDGLLHVSRISASGRVDKVDDVVSQDETVYVKVVEVKEEEGKYSLDMRFVNQTTGEDKDPNNVQVDAGSGKGKGGKADPIRIGAVQATTCTRCGARGHSAKECWAATGKQYDLLEELPPDLSSGDKPPSGVVEHDQKMVKAALKAYMKKQQSGEGSSSSSDSSSSSSGKKKKKKEKKKEKKEKKKERKQLKKQLKKEKKEQKKRVKELKKQLKSKKEKEGPAKAEKEKKGKKQDVSDAGSSSSSS